MTGLEKMEQGVDQIKKQNTFKLEVNMPRTTTKAEYKAAQHWLRDMARDIRIAFIGNIWNFEE